MSPGDATTRRAAGPSAQLSSGTREGSEAVGRPGPGRIAYAEVGAALRQAHERARVARLNGQEWRVFSVVADLTASYSKLTDRVYTEAIAEAAGVAPKRTREILGRLGGLAIIVYRPARGRHRPSLVGLRPPAEKGPEYGALFTGSEKAPEAGALSAEKAPESGAEKAPESEAPTEKVPEKSVAASSGSSRDSSDGEGEPEGFTRLVASFALSGRGRKEVLDAWRSDSERVVWIVEDCKQRSLGAGMIVHRVRAGDESPSSAKAAADDALDRAAEFVRTQGTHYSPDALRAELADRFPRLTEREVRETIAYAPYGG